MSTENRVIAGGVWLVAGVLAAAAGAAAQTTAPVVYQGLRHSTIGNAVLSKDAGRDALEVTTTDPGGKDGVTVDLGGTATSWAAHLGPTVDRGIPLVITWSAIADAQRISTAALRQVGDGVTLSARFTGSTTSTYAVQAYNNGRLVGSVGGLPPTAQTRIPSWVPCEFLENGCTFLWRFHNNVNSTCEWGIQLGEPERIVLPNGVEVTGNEVRMVEEIRPAGHYPYLAFDGVTTQTNARALTLFSETTR